MPANSPHQTRSITLETLELSLPRFHDQVVSFLDELGLGIGGLEVDHIGLRVNSQEAAARLRSQFSARGTELPVVEVNGRPICVFELHESLRFGEHHIPCVELPFPGSKLYPQEGWEHVEVVLPGDATDLNHLRRLFEGRFSSTLLENVPVGAVRCETNTGPNGEKASHTIAFERQPGLSVKFHQKPIKDIRLGE